MRQHYFFTALIAVFLLFQQASADDAPATKENWYPSAYGASDRLGAINNIDAKKVRKASRLVKKGKVYSLAIVTSSSTPAGLDRSYRVDAHPIFPEPIGENQLSGMDDNVETHMGVGTQIDGFGHVAVNHHHYNGLLDDQILQDNKLETYGIQDLPPIVTRGLLLDIAALKGVERLPGGMPINRAEIDAAMKRQGVRIQRGDVVLFHTGWLSLIDEDPEKMMTSQPGLGVEGAEYLAKLGVVAIGIDNPQFEHVPFANPNRPYEVHQTLLPKNGVYILEYVKTAELARDGVDEFLFVLGAPRLDGTVQGIVNPVAIY